MNFLNTGASAPVLKKMHFKHVLNCVKFRNKILCVHLTEICVRHKSFVEKKLLFCLRKKDKFFAGKKNLFQTFFCLFHIDQNNDHLLTKLFAPPYNVDVYARNFFQIILACINPFFENGADAPEFRCVFPLWSQKAQTTAVRGIYFLLYLLLIRNSLASARKQTV